ncbi:hypothetical protein J5N97_024583 [Dioscorea zingiberensis]|uniref:Uncharacterized protein n=1 Tax=Dioscorea zingiberensis TaxID=325984 RepID=A0A9D5H8U1_9LILI|nr:hypothetical protein J5N97_024583 [Dioscorea zingiberensis]
MLPRRREARSWPDLGAAQVLAPGASPVSQERDAGARAPAPSAAPPPPADALPGCPKPQLCPTPQPPYPAARRPSSARGQPGAAAAVRPAPCAPAVVILPYSGATASTAPPRPHLRPSLFSSLFSDPADQLWSSTLICPATRPFLARACTDEQRPLFFPDEIPEASKPQQPPLTGAIPGQTSRPPPRRAPGGPSTAPSLSSLPLCAAEVCKVPGKDIDRRSLNSGTRQGSRANGRE